MQLNFPECLYTDSSKQAARLRGNRTGSCPGKWKQGFDLVPLIKWRCSFWGIRVLHWLAAQPLWFRLGSGDLPQPVPSGQQAGCKGLHLPQWPVQSSSAPCSRTCGSFKHPLMLAGVGPLAILNWNTQLHSFSPSLVFQMGRLALIQFQRRLRPHSKTPAEETVF